jgi:DNA-3-methyladenine glycosylase I
MPNSNPKYLHTTKDGITRCWWGSEDVDYRHYHDNEWGRPESNDYRLFEKICLEGFQSGLSWLTILRKRENFRKAFADFDFNKLASFDDTDVNTLLQNTGIVRHRGKIEATLNNAQRAIEIVDEFGSLANYIWKWEPSTPEPHKGKGDYNHVIPSITKTSQALSKDLKKRGWKFFGPTTAYAFMQAMGLVNDHMDGCASRDKICELRKEFQVPCSKSPSKEK